MINISNRSKNPIKKAVVILITLLLAISFTACRKNSSPTPTNSNNETKKVSKSDKILVVYFSREGNTKDQSANSKADTTAGASLPTGNTRIIADQIHEAVGGDVFKIETLDPYPNDYNIVLDQAKKEQKAGYKPALKYKVSNMEDYEAVFIGYPIWWGTLPMAVENFLSEYNLSGKTIIPFSTNEGTRFGESIKDLKKLCPNSTIVDGFEVLGKNSKDAGKDVLKWLQNIGMSI